jgi:hypothetical protein
MKKVTLKLFEFYQLENELVGISNSQTGEVLLEGIFGLYTSLATKYWLYDLYKKVAAEKELIEVLKKELFTKYGNLDAPPSMYINEVIDEKTKEVISREINPKYIDFENEFSTLLNEEKEIEYGVRISDLEEFYKTKTRSIHPVFYKLIEPDTENA